MKLSRQIALKIAAAIAGIVLLAGASIWGLAGLSGYFDASADQYEHLRRIYEVGHHAATARRLLYLDAPDRGPILESLNAAAAALPATGDDAHADIHQRIAASLQDAASHITEGVPLPRAAAPINIALNHVTDLAQQIKAAIITNREAASEHLAMLTAAIAALSLTVIAAAVVLGRSQYRTTQQLVRAERLAGVGYLAAGAAHEINNPLAIISGYAEAALRPGASPITSDKALAVIVEQAFRCKQITTQLLALAAPESAAASAPRTAIALGPLIEHIARVVAGLPHVERRRIDARVADADLAVTANEHELTQVLTNLLTNAIEATDPESGRITMSAERYSGRALIRVTDNGRGMSADVARRVFEPFYTDRPRREPATRQSLALGAGLGLAVSHAIIERHGGSITATSPGEGRGSIFTIDLPVAAAASHPAELPVKPLHA